jgi:hypothetical protein
LHHLMPPLPRYWRYVSVVRTPLLWLGG